MSTPAQSPADKLGALVSIMRLYAPGSPVVSLCEHALGMQEASRLMGDPGIAEVVDSFVDQLQLGVCKGLTIDAERAIRRLQN